jgi:hypothetical protein
VIVQGSDAPADIRLESAGPTPPPHHTRDGHNPEVQLPDDVRAIWLAVEEIGAWRAAAVKTDARAKLDVVSKRDEPLAGYLPSNELVDTRLIVRAVAVREIRSESRFVTSTS